MKFSIKDFSSTCDQIRSFFRIWSHLLGKSLMENFIFLCSALAYSLYVHLYWGAILGKDLSNFVLW